MTRNSIIFILALVSYYAYLTQVSDSVSLEQRMLVNFILVPVLIGAIASISACGKLLNRILIIALVPIVPILFFGGDSAKSGMELMVIGPLVSMFAIGAAAGGALEYFVKMGRRE